MKHPVANGLVFAFFMFVAWATGALNYAQAGTIGAVGFFVLTALFYWRVVWAEHPRLRRVVTVLLFIFITAFFLFAVFQMALREMFGVQQDSVVVIESIFNTDRSESAEFLHQYGRQIAKYVFLFLLLTAAYLWWALTGRGVAVVRRQTVVACCVFTGLALLLHLNPTVRRNNPLLYVPIYYAKWRNDLETMQRLSQTLNDNVMLNENAARYTGERPENTVVWVIGESDTRHDWGLYGYSRNTTPRLAAHPELQVFDNVRAADAGTVISMTTMLTPATLKAPDAWKTLPSVMMLAKAAGYKMWWISNHGTDRRGVLGVFAMQADEPVFVNRGTSRGESSFDDAVLPAYRQALADPAPKKLIIVHLLGAHPAYHFRYPKDWEHFTLETDDEVIRSLRAQGRALYAIVQRNQYDNAIRYQDSILAALLEHAQRTKGPIAWLYLPDHGEDVAHHDNFAGHNHRALEMWEIPLLFWASKTFPVSPAPLDTPYQTDVIDHSILGLLRIDGDFYDPAHDLFSPSLMPPAKLVPPLPR